MVLVMAGTTTMPTMTRRTSATTFFGDYDDGDDDGAIHILMMTSTPMTMRVRSLMLTAMMTTMPLMMVARLMTMTLAVLR